MSTEGGLNPKLLCLTYYDDCGRQTDQREFLVQRIEDPVTTKILIETFQNK